ncbi:MAG TPA: hypothetical protein VGE76_10200 [Opitutaceae bacterium]
MSTTPHFKHIGAFPFCPAAPSHGTGYDVARGISLADAMALYWSLSDLAFTFVGSAAGVSGPTTSATGGFHFDGPELLGDFTNLNSGGASGALIDEDAPAGGVSYLPANTLAAYKRVCMGPTILIFSAGNTPFTDLTKPHSVTMEFYLCSDDLSPGDYAIEYRFYIAAGDQSTPTTAPPALVFINPAYRAAGVGPSTVYSSGSFYLGAALIEWEVTSFGFATSGSMDGDATFFTYV